VNLANLFKRKPKYLAVCEYWVYLPSRELPPQEEVMNRMLAQNPYRKAGQEPVGPAEGLLFSDIRLHVALVLRSKNPTQFRPDLFSERMNLTPEHLEGLTKSQAFVKVRYLSEEPLKDRRHVQFLPHLADAYAAMAGGLLVHDPISEQLRTRSDFAALLDRAVRVDDADSHLRIVWSELEQGAFGRTYGFLKIGLPDLEVAPVPRDHEHLTMQLLTEAAHRRWLGDPASPIELYGDQFELTMTLNKEGREEIRIHRHHGGASE
jgi:hypothetical protein